MPSYFAGFGLLGLGLCAVIAVATMTISMFERNEPLGYRNARNDNYSPEPLARAPSLDIGSSRRKRRNKCCNVCNHDIVIDRKVCLPCRHAFHEGCIEQIIPNTNNQILCPLCRRTFHRSSIQHYVNSEETVCAICLTEFTENIAATLYCGHNFHLACIQNVIINNEIRCPTCL